MVARRLLEPCLFSNDYGVHTCIKNTKLAPHFDIYRPVLNAQASDPLPGRQDELAPRPRTGLLTIHLEHRYQTTCPTTSRLIAGQLQRATMTEAMVS